MNGHPTAPIQPAPPTEIISSPEQALENAKATPLPTSPGERPSAGLGKAFPFKLGRTTADLGPEGANASTITLTTEAGVVPPPPRDRDSSASQTGTTTTIPDDDDHNDEQLHPLVDHDNNNNAHDETDPPPPPHHHQSSPIEPIEDAHDNHDGVDHYDLRKNNNHNHNLPSPLEGDDDDNGAELASNNAVRPAEGPEERRSTLVDAKGVLYHGPGGVVVGGLGLKKKMKDDDDDGGGPAMMKRRPGVDRSDTASLD